MQTKHVVGQRIVQVNQSPAETNGGRLVTLDNIILENGVRLFATAYETEDGPLGDLVYNEKQRTKTTRKALVERAAAAMWTYHQARTAGNGGGTPWKGLTAFAKDYWRKVAVAALDAAFPIIK